jgi:hypothetical protein
MLFGAACMPRRKKTWRIACVLLMVAMFRYFRRRLVGLGTWKEKDFLCLPWQRLDGWLSSLCWPR